MSRTNDKSLVAPAQTFSALRITEPVLAESKLGFIVTNGDPTGLTRNTLAGADFQYHNSHFAGGNILQSDLYYERTSSSKLGDDDAFGSGGSTSRTNRGADNFIVRQVGRNFAAGLGFCEPSRHPRLRSDAFREDALSRSVLALASIRRP